MHDNAETTQRGQIVVFFAIAIVAIIAMVGLIIDGGNAYANQRATQNAADAAAETGATVLAQSLLSKASGGAARTDGQVLAALNVSAADNNIRPFGPDDATHSVAYYTDILGNMLTSAGATTTNTAAAAPVGGGTIPACTTNCIGGQATGVRALGRRDFNPLVSAAVGFSTFTAQSDATAVSGYEQNPCDTAQGCAMLPVTFATYPATCDGTDTTQWDPTTPWSPATPPYGSTNPNNNEVNLAICKNGPGAFGYLDVGCTAPGPCNTATQISNPSHGPIPIPTWLQTQPGGTNAVENALNAYAGDSVGTYEPPGDPGQYDQVVLIPFFDGTCDSDQADSVAPIFAPPGSFPGVCPGGNAGTGSNTFYHIPFFYGFILDHAYVQGNNNPPCNQPPGNPPQLGGNGATACIKGWISFVVGPPGPVTANPGPGGPGTPLGVQLIR